MVLVDSVHPAEWENPTPEQLRMIKSGTEICFGLQRWLARLGFVRFCLTRLARGSPSWDGQRQTPSASARPQRTTDCR